MNCSRKTKIIAQGIAFFAAAQDMPDKDYAGSTEQHAWNGWRMTYPMWATFVINKQAREP